MAVLTQKNRPIGLVVADTGGIGGLLSGAFALSAIPTFTLLEPRPEEIAFSHPGRGTVIQTLDGGFIDDFGEGVSDITLRGHTGWSGTIPGELRYYALRDLVTLRFHQLRAAKAAAGQSINDVKMYLVDTLNLFMYDVYPLSFRGIRTRQQSLLYKYEIRLIGAKRLIGISDVIGSLGAML